VLDSDHLAERGVWESVEIAGRRVRAPGRFACLSATPLAPLGPAPRLGEHNGSVAPRTNAPRPAPSASARQLPLAGVKVLDLMWVMAGPAVTRVVTDFGATVVRVESSRRIETARTLQPFWNDQVDIEGSALYQNMNAGKLDITLDLGMPEGRAVVADLIRWADVVTESFAPGAMEAWGLDYAGIREINPSVVMLSSCLLGQTGPLRSFAGFGNLAAAFCGFTEIVGWQDRPPAGPFSAYSDYISPRIALATLLAAIDHRRRTGEGQYIDFSQAEGALHFLAPMLLDFEVNGRLPERIGNDDPGMAPHGVYAARGDDRWVAVACETDEQWRGLADVIGRADLASLPLAERLARRRELDAVVTAWTCQRDEQDVERELQAHRIPAHRVQNSPECHADPQLAALGHFVTTEHAQLGPVELEGPRVRLSATPGVVGPAPTLGQHVMTVLEDILGYDQERVTELLISGALE
jgi:crotonobetainyl-CoA:carnitine CoA-transferase CaiB-like acyl-CoA transferase